MAPGLSDFDLTFVGLSFLFSVLGSGTALLAIAVARRKQGGRRLAWTAMSGVLLGGVAIWSMHFIGMLAYQPGMPIGYQTSWTLLSAVPAIIGTAVGVGLVVGKSSVGRLLTGGVLVGAAVGAMHYSGMTAMRMPMAVGYSMPVVAVSLVIAVVAATAALWIALNISGALRAVAAVVMGVAVCGMHYTGMYAMRIGAPIENFEMGTGVFTQTDVTVAITAAAFVLLAAGAIGVGMEYVSMDAEPVAAT